MMPPNPVALRMRLPTPLVDLLPLLMVLTTRSVTAVSDWPMSVLLRLPLTCAPSPRRYMPRPPSAAVLPEMVALRVVTLPLRLNTAPPSPWEGYTVDCTSGTRAELPARVL